MDRCGPGSFFYVVELPKLVIFCARDVFRLGTFATGVVRLWLLRSLG